MLKTFFSLGAACALLTAASVATASTIEIQFTGVDVVYDGSTVQDANLSGADPLTTATLEVDGVPSTSSPLLSGLSLDFEIPDITDIAIAGDTVASTGGELDLNFAGGDFLSLDLTSSTVTFLNAAGFAQFAFAGSIADVAGQSLPDGLIIGGPVEVSLSTQIITRMDDGENLTMFTSRGTGEIQGEFIPEPSSLVLGGLGFAALATRRRR